MIKTNEPTRYEIEARHEDGRAYLICYSAGSPSLRRLVAAVGARGPKIAAALGIPANTDFNLVRGRNASAQAARWTIRYSGRTQREVVNSAGYAQPLPSLPVVE